MYPTLTRCEQETIIIYNNQDKTALVYTCHSKMKNKLRLFAEQFPEDVIIEKEDEISISAIVPKKCVASIRTPKKREVSDEQRQRMSEMAKSMSLKDDEDEEEDED